MPTISKKFTSRKSVNRSRIANKTKNIPNDYFKRYKVVETNSGAFSEVFERQDEPLRFSKSQKGERVTSILSFVQKSVEGAVDAVQDEKYLRIELLPSSFRVQIDSLQESWKRWIVENLPEFDEDRRVQILLCLREAVQNAFKHGCKNVDGGWILVFLSKKIEDSRECLRCRISDTGEGHCHDIRSINARLQQQRGEHLGLMLIDGLSDGMRFYHQAATIEFDFNLGKN